LIDADLRRPQINKILGVARSPGLSDVLLGVSEWENAVRSIDDLILGKYGLKNAHLNPGLEYLYFLSSGSRVDHPAELLGLDMLARIMTQLRDRYDIIVMDVAPVLPVADPSIVAPIVDATLLVYQIGRVGREVVNRSKARLDGLGANVVGVVMNDIEAEIDYLQDYALYAYRYGYEEAGRAGGRAGVLGRLKSGLSSALFGRSGKSAGRSPSKRS
jgi:tyrosine-protein kinase Etk/Wzc